LAILATGLLFSLQNDTSAAITWGVEKHKETAKWAIGEAVANLTLSIVLARKIGIYGVAIGTLVPNLFVQLVLWPRYVSQFVDVSYIQVFRNVWGPVFLCSIPFALASYAVEILFPPRNVLIFILQTAALMPIFWLVVGLTFRENLKRQILPRLKSFFYAHAR
jgi:peptidoglycan biosynthesis protein MviN/MurJ (putative lipid II flippase)